MTDDIEINVETDGDSEPETAPPAAPVTVIETDSSSDGVDPAIMQELLDLRENKVRNETRIAELEAAAQLAAEAAVTTAAAVEQQNAVVEEVAEAIEEIREGEQANADSDEEPHREHPFFRPIGRRD
jgi:predicted transcriptional regulator